MEIITEDELYSYLGVQDATDARMRLLLGQLGSYAEHAVRRFVGATLTPASYTHFLPTEQAPAFVNDSNTPIVRGTSITFGTPAGAAFLKLYETPVRSITSVHEDPSGYFGDVAGSFAAATALAAGTDFFLEKEISGLSTSGRLFRMGGVWPTELGSVKVVYAAGYADQKSIPYDYKVGILMQAASYWARAKDLEGGGPGKEPMSDAIASVSASYGGELGMYSLCKPAERLLWSRRNLRRSVA